MKLFSLVWYYYKWKIYYPVKANLFNLSNPPDVTIRSETLKGSDHQKITIRLKNKKIMEFKVKGRIYGIISHTSVRLLAEKWSDLLDESEYFDE